MEDYISRHEYDEFKRRIEEEDNRQNRRIQLLEDSSKQMSALTVSVEKMAVNMESMVTELNKQGEKLALLEQEPANKWKDATRALFDAFLGAFGAAVAGGVIYLITMIK